MADSKREIILTAIVDDVLSLITTGNGYNFTLATKERGLRNVSQLTDSHLPAIYVGSADEDRNNISQAQFRSDMTVFLYGYVKRPNIETGVQQQLDFLIEDLTKALWTDPTLSCKALDMEISRIDTDDGDTQTHASFAMQVIYRYKAAGTSP